MDLAHEALLGILARRMVRDIENAVMTCASQLAAEAPEFQLDLAWALWEPVHDLESRMRIEWKAMEQASLDSVGVNPDLSNADLDELKAFVRSWLGEVSKHVGVPHNTME